MRARRNLQTVLKSLAAGAVCALVGAAPARAQDESWTFDIGGQLRERFESANNPVFGLTPPVQNDYLLHRAALTAELNNNTGFRAVGGIVSGLVSGWSGAPPPTQDDSLDVLQAFVEQSVSTPIGQLALRIGRQEMSFGASRLVSVREGPNIRRAFDGVRALWAVGEDRGATAFFVRPVNPESGVFDDRASEEDRFWGVYTTWSTPRLDGLAFDTYYLGLDRSEAAFAQGNAPERRHTVGARLFGKRGRWDWNIESAWQWGSFGEDQIQAWTMSFAIAFKSTVLLLATRTELKADAISGDRNPTDNRLETFNPLFPKLPYFSEANLTTPANLLDVQPNLRLTLTTACSFTLSWNRLWKHERADAFYAPLLSPVDGTSLTQSRDIGWQASGLVEWRASERLELAATYVVFEPGAALRESGGRAGSFLAAWIRWTF